MWSSTFATDHRVASLQGALDRLIRGLRRGSRPSGNGRRLVIIQLDGLSRSVFEDALAAGTMPFVRRLLRHRAYRMARMSVGLPTSTPAFQMAAMYGVKPDIPGFHYYDRRRGEDVYFPKVGDAARVEAEHAGGRPGILSGGSSYGCVFSGGAERDVCTFAMLWRPTGRGLVTVLSSFVVLAWVLMKSVWLSVDEIFRAVVRRIRRPGARQHHWWPLALRLGSLWLRQLYTLVVASELYAGVPAIYVNYIDYDVFAHAFGPRHRHARRALRSLDASIRQLCSVLRRVPEHRYDLYILSDHGQTQTTPYQALHQGKRLEQELLDEVLSRGAPPARSTHGASNGTGRGASGHRAGVLRRILNFLKPGRPGTFDKMPEAAERDGIRVVSAGPNAFLYFVDAAAPLSLSEIDDRYPGLVNELSSHRGIGFVLVRSPHGPVCVHQGKRILLSAHDPGPFAGRADLDIVLAGIRDLMAMPSAGDVVMYGHGSGDGDVSFIAEFGAHAGPSPEELHTFIIHPARVRLPGRIVHPVELYPVFARYRSGQDLPVRDPATSRTGLQDLSCIFCN